MKPITNVVGFADAPFAHAHRGDVRIVGAVDRRRRHHPPEPRPRVTAGRARLSHAAIVALAACGSAPVFVPLHADEPAAEPAQAADAGAAEVAAAPAIPVDLEVTARIVEASVDKATGATIVTIAAGVNEGVHPDWTASLVDDGGAVRGRARLIEVKPRTATAATALAPRQLEGLRVRLASPVREPP